MRKVIVFTALTMFLVTNSATLADPVFGELFELRQPTGAVTEVRIWGDEFYRVVESLDGYTLTQDENTGFVCYARLSKDGSGLVSTGVPVGTVQSKNMGLPPHLRIRKEAARAKMMAALATLEAAEQEAQKSLGLLYESAQAPSTGNVRGICLIVEFPDEPGTIQPLEVDNFCNQIGYNGSGNNGSVRDYFFDVSDGHLTYTNFVPAAYYTASHTKSYYDNPSEPAGPKARELILEALNDLDSSGFDFSQYDADGDGLIDAINCLYAGDRASGWGMGLWPHSSALTFSADGVSSYKYQITDMRNTLTLRTFCHENGHMICYWPDLYDYGYESMGVGNYCLMASGGSATNPVEPCAYLKDLSGWTNTILLSGSQSGLGVTAGVNTFYKFEYSGFPNEYFLIENRQKTGRDAALSDSGLGIWHIDTEGSNNNEQMTTSQHYEASLEQADGKWDLENNRNAGDPTDLWKAPSYTLFGPLTSPSSNWWDGSQSGMTISQISASGSTMTFTFAATSQNHAPVLTDPCVEPISGTESTNFEFLVDYYDPDGDPPDADYRKLYISGGREEIMTLKSGTAADGTYHYTTTLPIGAYSYMFLFADSHGAPDMTDWQDGPFVYSDDDAVINIVVQCTRISSDLRLKYSLTGFGGPWSNIPITKAILDPLPVPSGSTVYFQASVASANYDYREWELYEHGEVIYSGTSTTWSFTLGPSTTEVGLNVYYNYTPQDYTISGTVLLSGGGPVPGGVDLTLISPEETMSQHTDDGNFSFTGIMGGVSVTITPSADGYGFSPAKLVYHNLKDNYPGETILAHPSDVYVPMTSFLTVPPAVSENSSVSFSWIGEDDVSPPENLEYQYKLEGVDEDWSSWASDTSKSYDVGNGAYTFWVHAKDEAENINQAPASYTFVVNAAPKVVSAVRINRSVWASRVMLEMPASPNHPNDVFILLPEHSGMSDSELVPVTIHHVADANPCGANAIVAYDLGLPVRIEKAGTGWLVTLPESIPLGQTAEYDIVWGKVKYFGWHEPVSVPKNFPNGSSEQSSTSYLNDDYRLWRMLTKKTLPATYPDSWVFMNVSDQYVAVVGETILRYVPGYPFDGSYGSYTDFPYGFVHKFAENIYYLWSDHKYEWDGASNENHISYGLTCFDKDGHLINTLDGPYDEGLSDLPRYAVGNHIWFTGYDPNDPHCVWFRARDWEGNLVVPKTIFECFSSGNSPWIHFNYASTVGLGDNILLIWRRQWETDAGYRREAICYQVRDRNGALVKGTTVLTPVLPDSVEKEDYYWFHSFLPDKEGKVWVTYWHAQTGQSDEFLYIILRADGNVYKGPVQTIQWRYFNFCDKDEYIWATEGGQVIILNSDDTVKVPPRPSGWIPNQNVGSVAASVCTDSYRVYDRWTPQILDVDVPTGLHPNSMELFSLNLWDNNSHPADINLTDGNTPVWSHPGQFTDHNTVDMSGVLSEGLNLFTMTQGDFFGGQILVTFPYVVPGDINGDGKVDWKDLKILCEQWLFYEIPFDLAPDGGDGIVNFLDWAVFTDGWQITSDFDDLAAFADQWLKSGASYCIADIAPGTDGDGIVNGVDFAALAAHWLEDSAPCFP